MELPSCMDLAGHGKHSSKYLLKLKKSLYGLKNAYLNWHDKLKDGFEGRGFVESLSDLCVFILKGMVILVYVDDCILNSKEDFIIQKFIDSMKDNPEGFEFIEERTMNAYLGVDIYPLLDGKVFTFSQQFLIDRIIQALGFDPKTTKGATKILQMDIHFWTKMKMVLPGKHIVNTVVSPACLDICKKQHVLTLQYQTINAQYLTMIHTFNMNHQSIISADIYWILETRAWSIDLTLRKV